MLVNQRGFTPEAKLDIEGVRKVLELRSQYGLPRKELTDPMKYYDPRITRRLPISFPDLGTSDSS